MTEPNPIEVFKKEAPDLADAFDGLIQKIVEHRGGLDSKTKQLIYIGIKASQGDGLAMQYHIPMAKKLGATRAEVRDAILMTIVTSGMRGIIACLPAAMSVYDNEA